MIDRTRIDLTADFNTLWRNAQRKPEAGDLPLCQVAHEFDQKLHDLIFTHVGNSASREQIAQAKYLLQEEWQAWRKSLPGWHAREADGHHRCLDAVYQASFDRLHLMDLTTRPPLHLLLDHYQPPGPSRPMVPPAEIDGILAGEIWEEPA